MNRLDVNAASREELIDVVKQLRQQVKQHQTSSKHAKYLEKQVEQLKEELREKTSAVEALTHQNAMLSEKSAADEETISVLIKQLEELNVGSMSATINEGIVEARAIPTNSSPSNPKEKRVAGVKVVQASSVKRFGGNSGSDAGVGVGAVPMASGSARGKQLGVPNAAAIIAEKNEEMAKLEMKVRELMEVNAFYSAIVSHHDEQERLQESKKNGLSTDEHKVVESVDGSRLSHEHISLLENERDHLQRLLRQEHQEKHVLVKELQDAREELSRLELDLVVAERWKASVASSLKSVEAMTPVHTSSWVQREESSSSRTSTQMLETVQCKNKHGKSTSNPTTTTTTTTTTAAATRLRSVNSSINMHTPPRALATSKSLPHLDTLPEIRLRNPSKQEKLLWERLELYKKCIGDMQAFELDRQRGFDEIERARAELFTEMNTKLEEQRREIQRLNKKNPTSVGVVGSSDSESRTVEHHRPVKDAVTSPIVNCVSGGDVNMQSFDEACSPISPGVDQLLTEENPVWASAKKEAREGENNVDLEGRSMDEKTLLELIRTDSESAQLMMIPSEKHEEEEGIEDEKKDVLSEEDEELNQQSKTLKREIEEHSEICHSCSPNTNYYTQQQLLDMAEEIERLSVYSEEGVGAVQIFSRSQVDLAVLVKKSTAEAAESMEKVDILENTLAQMRVYVSSLEEEEEKLVAEVARLKEEMNSMMKAKDISETSMSSGNEVVPSLFVNGICAGEPWEPLRYVHQAYSEVVNAQSALLRTISAPVVSTFMSNEEFDHVSNALDSILMKKNSVSSGSIKNKNGEKGFAPSLKGFEEGNSEIMKDLASLKTTSLLSSSASTASIKQINALSSVPQNYTSKADEKNDINDTKRPLDLHPKEQPATTTTTTTTTGEANLCGSQCASATGSSMWEMPSPALMEEHFFHIPHTEPISDMTQPFGGTRFNERFVPDPLDYFVSSRGTGEGIQRGGKVHDSTANGKLFVDLFAAVPTPEPHAKSNEDGKTFVAEFDPFA